MLRRLIIIGIVLLILVVAVIVGGDVIAKPMVERRIGEEIQQRYGLSERPSVKIGAFPFAVNGARGDIDHLEVTAENVAVEGLTIDRVELDVDDLHYSLRDVLQDKESATADRVDATARISQTALNRYLVDEQLAYVVTLTDDRVSVTGTVTVAGVDMPGSATGELSIVEGAMQFRPTDVSVPGMSLDVPTLTEATQRLTFAVPIPAVVGVTLTAVEVDEGFATLDAEVIDYQVMG